MPLRTIALAALLLTLAGCGAGGGDGKGAKAKGGGGPFGMGPAEVNVATVAPRTLAVTFEYAGQATGSREAEVRPRVGGILLKRNFEEGKPVKHGESLYSIDPAPFEAALARAEADVAAAQAREDQAQRNAARLKPLLSEKAVSQKEYDDAASAESIGAADVKSARARLLEAKLNLGYTRVEAPISGIASRSQRSEGSFVAGPDALLTTVVQVDPIWVNFGIPDHEQARLQEQAASGALQLPKGGLQVSLRRADGSAYPGTGRVDFADVRVNPATGTREMRASLPNPDLKLRPGEFVRVILKGATRPNALTVPQKAVLEGPQGKFVYVVNDKSAAEPRPVELGEWAGQDWVVLNGLKPGDEVIVDGLMKLGPGAPVKIAEPRQQKPPAKKQ